MNLKLHSIRVLQRSLIVLFLTLAFSISINENQNAFAQDKTDAQPRATIRAMSFNIRLGVAKDGDNHWNKRKDLVLKTIKSYDADLIGTQETWDFQAIYLDDSLPDYTYVGRPRQDDGKGEPCGILFRAKRFDKLIEGHFWLSETPDRPGSKSWDSSLPRMVTWLKLWDRVNEKSIYVINTHFDHRGKIAREESAKQIRKFVESLPKESNVVVTGDFNASVGTGPYDSLFGGVPVRDDPFGEDSDSRSPSLVIDTFLAVGHGDDEPEGTFNGFKGTATGARIDWIGASRTIKVLSAGIDRSSFEGRYPSDHFPVTAEFSFGD